MGCISSKAPKHQSDGRQGSQSIYQPIEAVFADVTTAIDVSEAKTSRSLTTNPITDGQQKEEISLQKELPHVAALTSMYTSIIESMQPVEVMRAMLERKLLTPRDYEELKRSLENKGPTEASEKIHQVVMNNPEKQFVQFLQVLQSTHHTLLHHNLQESYTNHQGAAAEVHASENQPYTPQMRQQHPEEDDSSVFLSDIKLQKEIPHITVLRSTSTSIIESMQPVEVMLPMLEKKLLTLREYEELKRSLENKGPTEAAEKIHQIMLRKRDEKKFFQFLKVLSSTSHEHLYNKFIQKHRHKKEQIRASQMSTDQVGDAKRMLIEAIENKYKRHYQYVPRKPWIKDDFVEMDTIFVNIELLERQEFRKANPPKCYESYNKLLNVNIGNCNKYIIAGKPGMGKTTLAQKMCYDWATRNSEFEISKYKCVFLVKARELKTDIGKHIIKTYMPTEQHNLALEECIRILLTKETTLIIMDGLDEGSSKSNIMKVVSGDLYPSVHVVVTTRPHSLPMLRDIPQLSLNHFNISGFSKDDVKRYINMYFTTANDNTEGKDRLYKEINKKKLWDLAESPLICLLLCYLWEKTGDLPTKKTDIYEQMLVVFKTIFEDKNSGKKWEHLINKVGKLSLDMLLNEKDGTLIFDSNTVSQYVEVEDANQMGLLTAVEQALGSRSSVENFIQASNTSWFSFLHKSIQEFCAALYVHTSTLSGEEVVLEKVKKFLKSPEYAESSDLFLTFIHDLGLKCKSDQTAGFKLMLYVTEQMDTNEKFQVPHKFLHRSLCERQFDWWKSGIQNKDFISTIFAYNSTRFLSLYEEYRKSVSNTIDSSKTSLKLKHIYISLSGRQKLDNERDLLAIIKANQCLRSVHIKSVDLQVLGADLGTALPDNVVSLIVGSCNLSANSLCAIFDNVHRLRMLKSLNISGNDKCSTNIPPPPPTIPTCTLALEVIDMNKCNAPENVIKRIIPVLKASLQLKLLNLSFNFIGECGAELASILPSTLKEVNVRNCCLTAKSLCAFVDNLHRLPVLKTLDVSDNTVNQKLMPPLPSTSPIYTLALEEIDMKKCIATAGGIKRTLSVVKAAKQLKKLNISFNFIGECATELASILPSTVEEMELSYCHLTTNSFCAVIDNIYRLPVLKTLNVAFSTLLNANISPPLPSHKPIGALALEAIDMQKLQARECIIERILPVVKAAKNLKKINISFNCIGESGASIAAAFPATLEELQLSNCKLTDNSITALINSISSLPQLKNVNLSHNNVSESGVKLAGALSSSVEYMGLVECNLTSDSITAIIQNIPRWDRLQKLALSLNECSDEKVWSEMLSVLPKCTHNRLFIHVANCNISRDMIKSMKKCNKNIVIKDTSRDKISV